MNKEIKEYGKFFITNEDEDGSIDFYTEFLEGGIDFGEINFNIEFPNKDIWYRYHIPTFGIEFESKHSNCYHVISLLGEERIKSLAEIIINSLEKNSKHKLKNGALNP